jgi:asparagine synthase (glutamine-hydrolysing)
MCGIVGFKLFSSNGKENSTQLKSAIVALGNRGPDTNGLYIHDQVGLGHTRLSIIDTSKNGNQPMTDPSGRYTLVFNGEIYNFKELRKELSPVEFSSDTDTEVLLHLLIQQGEECLKKLNGFFSFSFYDEKEGCLLIARDRMGIKPLHYYQDEHQFIFGSEMKALMQFSIPRKLNSEAIYWYLKLNYIPGNLSMLKGFHKLEPGHFIAINGATVKKEKYWTVSESRDETSMNYSSAQNQLVELLDQSVQRRLMADVPLGSFLSGGTDSSAIVALASKHRPDLSTFSIGYKDHSFFDETHYAELVAKKFNTNHTTFSLTNDDMLNDLDDIINYIDEPFADSSAIPTYILSKHVSKHIKVALSGDGADELFGGYYKHMALSRSSKPSVENWLLKSLNPLIKSLPQSRSGKWSNLFRRLDRYGAMLKMSAAERYWFLASLTNDPSHLLREKTDESSIRDFKNQFISGIPDLNEYLKVDLQVLLPSDMLTKVDLMSMANSLEVRVPFLDKDVVNFALSLPNDFKVKGSERKRIVQDAFKSILPKEIYHRPKKGFEVPLLDWMRKELLPDLDEVLFNRDRLAQQNLFNTENVMALRTKMLSNNPGDVHGTIWALYIFQKWYANWKIES